jgi:hypothetical protein
LSLADSPLRDRVVFVEGAPRSGTTLLTVLLSAHPEIAAVTTESHLFDSGRGVGALFDNLEGEPPHRSHLVGYVSRERLVELVRGLCDGVLEEMRSRVAPQARFVLEKTPAALVRPEVPLARKRECYPDAWFVHMIREPGAVVRSLRRAPWSPDRSRAASERWQRGAVGAIRGVFGDLPRYRELFYEELVADPVAVVEGVFGWLGLECDDPLRAEVRRLSAERFSELRAPVGGERASGLRGRTRAVAGALRRGPRRRARVDERPELGEAFAAAIRERDPEALARVADERLVAEVRTADGDLTAEGDRALAALEALAARLFAHRYLSQAWSVAGGQPFTSVLFSGVRADGPRVDLSFTLGIAGSRITRVAVLIAGGLDGRPPKELSL